MTCPCFPPLLARDLLGIEFQQERLPFRQYDLSVLLQPNDFPTDPADGIAAVEVRSLRLMPLDSIGERVTLECLRKADRSIWDMARERFGDSDPLQGGWVADGRIRGHVDGIINAGPVLTGFPALWECKSMNAKSWKDTVKKGLAISKPSHAGGQIAGCRSMLQQQRNGHTGIIPVNLRSGCNYLQSSGPNDRQIVSMGRAVFCAMGAKPRRPGYRSGGVRYSRAGLLFLIVVIALLSTAADLTASDKSEGINS